MGHPWASSRGAWRARDATRQGAGRRRFGHHGRLSTLFQTEALPFKIRPFPGRQAVRHRPKLTNDNHRQPDIKPAQSLDRGSELVGDGRVDLYAGFCDRHAPRGARAGGGHPSRPAVAGRLERPTRRHRAGRPQASARAVVLLVDGPFLALLRVGFTEPPRSPGVLVGSYPTVSPLPSPMGSAVCFLWHCPAGRPGLPLATTLPCGVRTFLGGGPGPADATARSTRPSRTHPNDATGASIATPGPAGTRRAVGAY